MAGDFTALAVVERPEVGPRDPPSLRRPAYSLRHLHRFPLGTPYGEVVEELRRLLNTEPLPGTFVVVDQTGVGKSVVDMVADGLRGWATCHFWPVTLSAGHEVTTSESGHFYIPKKELISCLQVLLQARRFRVAGSLPDAHLLMKELETFKLRVTMARDETMESWREGPHDDLVFAAALAVWVVEQGLPPLHEPPDEPLTVLTA
jgi:hypothetical protein